MKAQGGRTLAIGQIVTVTCDVPMFDCEYAIVELLMSGRPDRVQIKDKTGRHAVVNACEVEVL